MKRTSIQDIADVLGVSKGTVSLVLSGKAKGNRISEQMSKKVKDTAEKLNYQPNEIARSLSLGKTRSIGVIVTDISNEFFGRLTFHIQEQAKKYGYSVITTNTNESLEEFDNAVTTLLNRQIDGIIFVPVDSGLKIAEKIMKRNVPMVQIDRFYPEINANYIVVDNYNISAQATELLIRKGLRRIAVVCYDINLNALRERRRACTDMLERYNLLDSGLVFDIDYQKQEEEIEKAIVDIKNSSEKVEAIFFCSRRVFLTGIKYMYRENISIPDDMEVVCFDKIESFVMANFPIYYIEQPVREMGEKSVDILMEQIENVEDVKQYVLNAKLELSTQLKS